MKPAVFAPKARRDIIEAINWIVTDNPIAAWAFHEAIEQAARNLGEHARLGSERSDLVNPPFRIFPLTSFPYIIIYNPTRTPPVILRVLHGARDLPEILENL